MSEIDVVMSDQEAESTNEVAANLNQPSREFTQHASGLRIEVIKCGAHLETEGDGWWADVAVHADVSDEGTLEIALYFEAQRVAIGYLDQWGDWNGRLNHLRVPVRKGLVSFEVAARPVRLRAESTLFEIPIGGVELTRLVEKERGWSRERSLQGAHF